MRPKSAITRENDAASHFQKPKQRKHKRRGVASDENAPPRDVNSMSPAPFSAKLKSRLPPRPPSCNPLKRKLSVESAGESSVKRCSDCGVKVIVRMRPLSNEEESGELIVNKISSDSVSINGHIFTFDSVADMGATQQDIFQLIGAPLVENCLAGFNSSVFAYGQTGSGKTYTMWGPANALLDKQLSSDQKGLTPLVLERLFARINEEQIKHFDKQLKYQCRCSFLEIYNEQITDLLDPIQRNLQIREDVKSGIYVENLTEECIYTMKDVTRLLIKGMSNRRTGATSINVDSSRSHCVFTCIVELRYKSEAGCISSLRRSRINLVDLAGSERQKSTGAAGERLKEAGNINRSLSQLGNLINILADVSQSGKQRHIPYRDSRLTFLLQDSLGGNAKLAMICAISPAKRCKNETFSTLRFAQRAKAIKNKAVVNEVVEDDVNILRDIISQLKDELLRMKAAGNSPAGSHGGYTPRFVRRSLHLLKYSLNRPMILPHDDDDGDEVMEIDEEAVEKLGVQVDNPIKMNKELVGQPDDTDVEMEEAILEKFDKQEISKDEPVEILRITSDASSCSAVNKGYTEVENNEKFLDITANSVDKDSSVKLTDDKIPGSSSSLLNEKLPSVVENGGTVPLVVEPQKGSSTTYSLKNPLNKPLDATEHVRLPCALGVVSCEASPTYSVSPRVTDSRKSLRTSSMCTASHNICKDENKTAQDAVHLSFLKPTNNCSSNVLCTQASKNVRATTEHLAASLHHGLEVIDKNCQQSPSRLSPYRLSYKPTDVKPLLQVQKVDRGVQTISQYEDAVQEDMEVSLCNKCKNMILLEVKEDNHVKNMQSVPIDGDNTHKLMKQVPKAVEKVLAGSFRREMDLEAFCAKQASEMVQLNRLVQQYKHERECNAVIAQIREDKILRLEGLMDGILTTEDFMEEELFSLRNEHKLLQERYENHPELLRTKIELQKVLDQLEHYRNFFELGEKEVLIEEIQDLRRQLQCYIDTSSASAQKRTPLFQLTYQSEPNSVRALGIVTESNVESAEEKFEQERSQWAEAENKWISYAEKLRTELEAAQSFSEKRKQELDTEKRFSDELKEALQLAMSGNARILEQYADLEEKHMQLLVRHRKIQEGIEDVKSAAATAGISSAESKFINALAAEISALKSEREKERRYFRDEHKGLKSQLRDTAEAVQAAGELLVRLKEAEEAVAAAQKQASDAKKETEKAYKKVEELKREHDNQASHCNQLEPCIPKEISKADCDSTTVATDQLLREESEPLGDFEEKLGDPTSWFSGYDKCNI